MPSNTNQKNRLPSWNLLFLALILSGGGFVWHTNQQQQLLDRLDSQIISTTKIAELFYTDITAKNPTPELLCENLAAISKLSAAVLNLSIYSSEGDSICSTEKSVRDSHEKKSLPIVTSSPKTITESRENLRSLTYQIGNAGQTPLYLSVSSNLAELKQKNSPSNLILFLLGIFILSSFAVLQRKLRSRSLVAIKRLSRMMAKTETDALPPTFKVPEAAEPEVQELANSYNNMIARQTNKLRLARQYATEVTHELRTPLTILRGETELALRNDRDNKQLRQVLVSNLEEISRMSYLVEDLLLLSKGELGEIPLKMEPQQLHKLMDELHHQAQLLATTKNIKLVLHCPPEQITLQADSLRLRQVFLNLLTNAIKYTPTGGTVTIKLSTAENYAEISISDTGVGIESQHLETIFERFYRVDKTGNRNDGGSGLGLAIAKWLVDAHNGTIKVNSTPGQGSNFTVIIPLSQDMPTAVTAALN